MVCEKKPGRASKILGNLTDGADIGTCKISAQLVQWLLRNSHQKTVTVCPELFGHWRFSETSDLIVKIQKGMHSYMQKLTFDPFPKLKAIKAVND